ncbi:substrate-binding domain-containing protein [Vibrio nigripulchritudo]|uniref:substrate-binding domain-containing protein n=1 Tax=Vibrio nigripulchritudo TaxID=28173 RepID=UPI00249139DF|nr:substrate-binding domain-containing protein [Vibrio nigripulchritudo]BDU36282.1 hypothetical protein TUMSATVNIG2_07510 [Vibrio nigripulchritudo]BDU41939.1 hypothetical protein TUMSATVNIG3_07370 [Vibrio nigripulchritudo]
MVIVSPTNTPIMNQRLREQAILHVLENRRNVTISQLVQEFPQVANVTIRRDVARLAKRGKLERSHGAVHAVKTPTLPKAEQNEVGLREVDALILPPIHEPWGELIKQRALAEGLPILSESAPDSQCTYIGPDNLEVGYQLGTFAARELNDAGVHEANLLLINHTQLSNTQQRTKGFLRGFHQQYLGEATTLSVDGFGHYRTALRQVQDAIATHPEINVLFGVNDHSILAGLEATKGHSDIYAYSVGLEGDDLLDELTYGNRLHACVALYPELVGYMAAHTTAKLVAGQPSQPVLTPFDILTGKDVHTRFTRQNDHWVLKKTLHEMAGKEFTPHSGAGKKARVMFVPHYIDHSWYRKLAKSLEAECEQLELHCEIQPPEIQFHKEVQHARERIAQMAIQVLTRESKVFINHGAFALPLANALREAGGNHTVVTNSLAVFQLLKNNANDFRVILTGGETQTDHSALVGSACIAVLEQMRVDKVFLSVDGISAKFGISMNDEASSQVAKSAMLRAHQTIVLGEASQMGAEENYLIAPLDTITDVMTDLGTIPAQRLELAANGVRVHLAEDYLKSDDKTHAVMQHKKQGDSL